MRTARRIPELLGLAQSEDERAAAATLGKEHALARLLARPRTLTSQILVTAIPLLLALAGTLLGVGRAVVVLAAAGIVEIALLVTATYVRGRTRDVTQDLISAGDERALALRSVRAEGLRLVSRRERERLARSLESLLREAERWHRTLPAYRPPDGAQLLRHAGAEVREIVSLLRAETAHLRGVALTARLLLDGYRSPLYAGDAGRLREELNRIRYLLRAPDRRVLAAAA